MHRDTDSTPLVKARQALCRLGLEMWRQHDSRSKTARKLTLGPGKVDQRVTDGLRKTKLFARSNGNLNDSVISAGYHAKKYNLTYYVYLGNSYMNAVWRASYKAHDYLDPISNTGDTVYSVSPELEVRLHKVR